jgi:hypothetical protein
VGEATKRVIAFHCKTQSISPASYDPCPSTSWAVQLQITSLDQKDRDRTRALARVNRFFVLMLDLTSGCTIKRIALGPNLSRALRMQSIQGTLLDIEATMHQSFPSTQVEVRCDCPVDDHPEVFGTARASRIFIPGHQKSSTRGSIGDTA